MPIGLEPEELSGEIGADVVVRDERRDAAARQLFDHADELVPDRSLEFLADRVHVGCALELDHRLLDQAVRRNPRELVSPITRA
jgi:hypothetical protein